MKFIILNIIILFTFCFCKPRDIGSESRNADSDNISLSQYSPLDYLKWVESEDGLRATKKIEKIEFQLQLTPSNYLVLKENLDSLNDFSESKLIASTKTYDELQYFKLRISIDEFHDEIIKYNIRNDNEYEERVKYFSFYMQNNFKLIDGIDTLPCVMFNYERTFNLTPNSNFQIAFPSTLNKASKTLVYDDIYLGTGKVMLTINKEKIKLIPKIIF